MGGGRGPAGRGRPGAPRGTALTVQPGLPVRSHPQEGLQRGDKSGEVSGPAGDGCKHLPPHPPPPPGKQGPAPPHPLPAAPRTHLFPAPAAGPPPAALHSRGRRGRPTGQRGGGPRGGPPRAARDAGGYGAARQAPPISPQRPPPCWPRSCDPPAERVKVHQETGGERRERRKFPWQPTGGSRAQRAPANQGPGAAGTQGHLANQGGGVTGTRVPGQSGIRSH